MLSIALVRINSYIVWYFSIVYFQIYIIMYTCT